MRQNLISVPVGLEGLMTKSNTWALKKGRTEIENVVARALTGTPQTITSRRGGANGLRSVVL
jgi:hypothetical protein